jgi:hypothetical protein
MNLSSGKQASFEKTSEKPGNEQDTYNYDDEDDDDYIDDDDEYYSDEDGRDIVHGLSKGPNAQVIFFIQKSIFILYHILEKEKKVKLKRINI